MYQTISWFVYCDNRSHGLDKHSNTKMMWDNYGKYDEVGHSNTKRYFPNIYFLCWNEFMCQCTHQVILSFLIK